MKACMENNIEIVLTLLRDTRDLCDLNTKNYVRIHSRPNLIVYFSERRDSTHESLFFESF